MEIRPVKNREAPLVDVKYVRVIDGDTVIISYNGIEVKCRIADIQAPEKRHRLKGCRTAWDESKEYLEQLLIGQDIQARFVGKTVDKYRRELVRLYVQGKSIGSQMIKDGRAIRYVFKSD